MQHKTQEHSFGEGEHSTTGSIISAEESIKIWEVSQVPAAESGQCSTTHN